MRSLLYIVLLMCATLSLLDVCACDEHDAMSAGAVRSVQYFSSEKEASAAAHGAHTAGMGRFHGLSASASVSSSLVVLVPDVTAGPYPESLSDYVYGSDLVSAAIAGASGVTSNRTSVLNAIPFAFTMNIYNVTGNTAVPLEGAAVYIWHCDAIGVYSAVALSSAPANHEDTTGQKWLRGYQTTSSSGAVTFNTIIPGWYLPRFVHFHIRVRLANAATNNTWAVTTQLFPTQALVNGITSLSPYSGDTQSLTALASDQVYTSVSSSLASELILNTTGSTSGYSATFNLGIDSSSTSSSSASSTTASPTTTAVTSTTTTTTATATATAATTTTTATAAGSTKSSALSTNSFGSSAALATQLMCALVCLFCITLH